MRVHCLADRFWLSATFAAPNDAAALVDDADRGGLKRHIKADVVLLIHGNASERWLPAEATGQSAPDPRRDYAMSRGVRPNGNQSGYHQPGSPGRSPSSTFPADSK